MSPAAKKTVPGFAATFSPFLLLGASPRPGGNSDTAVRLFAEAFAQAGGDEITPVFLRNHPVFPCVSCNACTRAAQSGDLYLPDTPCPGTTECPDPGPFTPARRLPFGCPQTLKDDSVPLLHSLLTAKSLCIVAPIYFYHLPAALKALIDRTQPFWALTAADDAMLTSLPPRRCQVILIAARKKGEQLFSGSLLTLKQVFKPLQIKLDEPLLLRGIDEPGDLKNSPDAVQAVTNYARAAALSAIDF